MIKRLILFISLVLGACRDYEETACLTQVNAMVLNRRTYSINSSRGGHSTTYYQVYLYNGVESKWYLTDEETYRKLRPRDTIASFVLTITKTRKE